jgi:hypothetical protein
VTSRRLLALALLVAMLAISVGACGIPADESPRAISEDALPAELNPNASTSTTLPPGPRERHDFFYVTGDEEPNTARLGALHLSRVAAGPCALRAVRSA